MTELKVSPFRRFWTYQRERFPLLQHSVLIAVFSLSAVSYSTLLRGARPSLMGALVAFISCLLFFLQLRIADEHKDANDDAQFRPYRPVPRGLVTLKELRFVGIAAAALQAGLALWLEPRLLWLLLLVWGYGVLMTAEFFVPEWLKARPLMYLWTHMLIMPFVGLYATAADWLPAGEQQPGSALVWWLAISFFNGMVIEIGRKLRAPEDEEKGVETYSKLYGLRRGGLLWLAAMAASSLAALFAAWQVGFLWPVMVLLLVLLITDAALSWHFVRRPVAGGGEWLELLAAIWTLALYLSVGVLPLVWRLVGG